MSWYKYGDAILTEDGAIAISEACCCVEPCCGCELLDIAALLNLNMRVTVSGPITGVCRMDFRGAGEHGLLCPHWEYEFGFCYSGLDGCQTSYHLNSMYFFCPEGATSSTDYQFEAALSNLGCNFVAGDATPVILPVAWRPEVFTCPDTGDYTDFYARFRFPLESTFGVNGCNCGGDDIIFEIEID